MFQQHGSIVPYTLEVADFLRSSIRQPPIVFYGWTSCSYQLFRSYRNGLVNIRQLSDQEFQQRLIYRGVLPLFAICGRMQSLLQMTQQLCNAVSTCDTCHNYIVSPFCPIMFLSCPSHLLTLSHPYSTFRSSSYYLTTLTSRSCHVPTISHCFYILNKFLKVMLTQDRASGK